MRKAGSTASPALPPLVAIAAVVLGGAAMLATMAATAPWGLRPMLVASELALAAPALLTFALARLPWSRSLGLAPPGGRTAMLSLAVGAAFWVASIGLFSVQSLLWPFPPEYLEGFQRLHAALRPAGPIDAVVSIAAIALVPAVCEELLFRGILLPALRRWLPASAAVAVTAVLFGAIHLDPYRFAFAAVVGVGLCLLRLRTGSVVAPLLAHGLLNTLTFAVVLFMDEAQAAAEPAPWVGALLLLGGSAVAAAVLRAIRPGNAPG
jgi:membrane protease YdiL (CAAX protease family)